MARGARTLERQDAAPVALSPQDEDLKLRALHSTGVMAREVLGLDYDFDYATGQQVRPGGIRDSGPHLDMVEHLDRLSRYKHLEAPRGSYKTSLLHAYAVRRVLANPNVRVLYVMHTFEHAKKNIGKLNEYFTNKRGTLFRLWGDLIESGGVTEFTISGRTDAGLKEPTFSAAGIDKNVTGGHYDVIILDDVVHKDNVQTSDQIEKTLDYFRMVQPLLTPGGTLIVDGTRYADADLYGYILSDLKHRFDTLILDAGVDLIRDEGKPPRLEGTPRFAHLTLEYLYLQLDIMKAPMFSSQYLNQCLASASVQFRRSNFRYEEWGSWMSSLATYMVTDTAASSEDDGCLSVVGIVGLDAVDNAYLLDLTFGLWGDTNTFVKEFVDMYQRWQAKTALRGALFENIAMNRTFRPGLERAAKDRQLRINFIPTQRGMGELSKEQRIRRLQPRLHEGRFFVVSTVPRFIDLNGEARLVFDPLGHNSGRYPNGDQILEPDGELVKSFIRFPTYGWKDIPYALADIDAVDTKGNRICTGASLKAITQAKDAHHNRGRRISVNEQPGFYAEMSRRAVMGVR